MSRKDFIASIIMMGYKRVSPVNKFPVTLHKEDVLVQVYNKNVIVRLGSNTKNNRLNLNVNDFITFLDNTTSEDYIQTSETI